MTSEELQARTDAALARLDAATPAPAGRGGIQPGGPGTAVTCPQCGKADIYEGDAESELLHCDYCKAALAYGVLMPKWTNEPHEDARFLRMKVEAAKGTVVTLTLERSYARAVALDILSVCPAPENAEPQ